MKKLDNKKKCFLGTKSAYENNVTLKTEVMAPKNSAFASKE